MSRPSAALQTLRLNEKPKVVLIQSALAIWFGLLMLMAPGYAGRSIALILGLFLVLDGGFTIISKAGVRSKASLILSALAVVAGLIALLNPVWLGIPMVLAFSLWAFFHGCMNVMAMFSRRANRRLAIWFGLSGAASLGISLWIFSHLGSDLSSLIRYTGVFGVIYGYTLLGLGYELSHVQEETEGVIPLRRAA